MIYNSDGSVANIQALHDAAVNGDTITIPSGSFTWITTLHITKGITLMGAGLGVTNITLSGHPILWVTKNATNVTRVQDMSFSVTGGAGTLPDPILLDGTWPTGQPIIFQRIGVTLNGASLISCDVCGGVVFSNINFSGQWNDFFISVKDQVNTSSWTTADSIGTNDTDGTKNIYIEDSTFTGGSNGIIDCDDNCRVVMRHNIFSECGGFNSHGKDTSTYGGRHFELYSNSFLFPDHTCLNGNTSLSNINQFIWIRGGTGVIYNNNLDHLSSQCWGTKPEIRISIRGAEDARPQGTCMQVAYPVPHQCGRNYSTVEFTDPIWFWGNIANQTTCVAFGGWAWGNPCSFDWNTFFQWGRDGANTALTLPIVLPSAGGSVDATGGTAKPGYTAYTYPHPLLAVTTGCTVPNFIGRKIRVATSLWTTAGFDALNITLEGNLGDTIKTQTLPAGSTGQCSSAVITVSRRAPQTPPNPVDPGQISGISTTTGKVDVNYIKPGVKVKHQPPFFSTNPARRTLGFFYLWPAFSDSGHVPDFSQCNGLANPFMSGILLRETWALIEPNLDGNYDWSYLDGCVAACASAGKLFSFQHLAGYYSPTPLFSEPDVNFLDLTTVGNTAINWDSVTQTHYQALHTAMAARYKNNRYMGYVVMSLVGRASESFLTNNQDPEDYTEATNLAIDMGYDSAEAAWVAGTKWNIDMMIAKWSPVPVVFTTGVPFPTDAGTAAQLEVINYGNGSVHSNYRGKFGVRRNDISHAGPPDNSYVNITSPYCKASGYQPTQTQRTNDPSPPTFFGQMVTRGTNYLSNKKGILEVFPGDVDPWNTEPATATILANANWST